MRRPAAPLWLDAMVVRNHTGGMLQRAQRGCASWRGLALLTLLATAAGGARAHEAGIERIAMLEPAMAHEVPVEAVPDLAPRLFRTSASHHILEVPRNEPRWWRIDPLPAQGQVRVLAVYNPYSARVTVLLPPDYVARSTSLFDPQADPRHSRHALNFELAPEAAGPVYLRVEDARGYPLRIAVEDLDRFAASDLGYVRVISAATATLLAVGLVVGLFWLRMRERVYLQFALYMATQAMYLLTATGEAFALPLLGALAGLGPPVVWLFASAAAAAGVFFLREFAELPRYSPRLDHALRALGYALVLLMVSLAVPWPFGNDWYPDVGNLLLLACNLIALAALVAAVAGGGRHARYVLVAWAPIVAVSTARAVQLSGGMAYQPWLEYGLPGVLAFAAVVLTFGLADRMSMFRSERDTALAQAERDTLTGALNRGALRQRLDRAVLEARAEREPLSVLFLDLDHFKRTNDRYGHLVGDACLRAVAAVIERGLRQSDQLARYGGEELVVVLPGAGTEHARGAAERIRREVQRDCAAIEGAPVQLTVSIGVATLHPGHDSVESLLERADAAMYAAKHAGRNRVVVASD